MKKVLYISAALSLLAVPAARAQHEGHSMSGAGTAPPGQQQQPRQQQSAMDPRVEGALAEVERLNRVLEAARESNDPVRLRASMDELQSSLGAISGQLRSAAPAPETGGMSGMNMGGASGASGSSGMSGMDHSKMDMKGSGSGTSGMDHSKMDMKGSGSGKSGMDHSKIDMKGSGSGTSGMDHSKMDKSGSGSGKSSMDHSKMKMSGSGSGKSGAGDQMDHSKMGDMPGMNAPETKSHSASGSPEGSANSQDSPLAKTKDPICFQEVATQGAEKATYKGKTYYFCSRADKEKFLSDPAKYEKR